MDRDIEEAVDGTRVAALRDGVDAEGVDELADRLASDDADVRAGAAWRLVETAATEPAAVRPVADDLLDAVDDSDVWVRRGATWALAELADPEPDALAGSFGALVALTGADDPLVRERGVAAVAAVAAAYPARASRGLSALAPLLESPDALVKRAARSGVREVVAAIAERAEDAGYPVVVRARPAYVDLFPEGVSVVAVDGDDDRTRAVHVAVGRDAPTRTTDERDDEGGSGPGRPPEEVPDAPRVTLSADDVTSEAALGSGVLTTDYRASVDESVLEHGVVTLRRLEGGGSAVESAFADAVEQWASVDDHDHVVTVLGHGRRWVATRYTGDSLESRGAPETLAEAVWNVEAVTRAASHAHARGVVHGGLHAGAVRYVETGTGTWDAPVLADWGFAHAASGERTPPVPAGFAAPEHHDPETYGRFDQATDVYGLGALAYVLLTGATPGPPDSRVPATEVNPALPAAVEDVLGRALAAEKPARFATVLDFQRALEDVAGEVEGVA